MNTPADRTYMPLQLADYEKPSWDVYFATMAGWQFHPGQVHTGSSLPISKCAELADLMILERRKR